MDLEIILNVKKEAISRKFSSLRTSYIRERTREKASKSSGTGTDDVYTSTWKLFKEMDFLRDEIEGDESTDNMKLPNKKRKKSKDMEDNIKVELWQSALAALRVPVKAAGDYRE